MNKIILIVMLCALMGSVGQLFFKMASKDFELSFSFLLNWKLWVALAIYGVSTAMFIYALKHGNLSVLYPILATSYIWVALFSILFLGEKFPVYKWIGIILIIAGVFIVAK